ncbi:MAG: hypothetical protein ABGW69_00200, partial [Nanoarchaeota archaeon]
FFKVRILSLRDLKKAQTTAIILLIFGILVIAGGYFIFEVKFKEKKEKETTQQVIQINTQQEKMEKSQYFLLKLQSCIDSLVRQGLKESFNKVLNEKKIEAIDNLPVVLDGNKKVNINFGEIKNFIEDYVKNNFYICQNEVYNYKETRGVYIFTNLKNFEVYPKGWIAKIKYKIRNIKDDSQFTEETDLEGKISDIQDLLGLYNGLIDYEYSKRAMEWNLFTLIYDPLAYAGIYGYPSTNLIIPCRKLVFDLNYARNKIEDVLSYLISKYRVANTGNSYDTEQVFRIPYLKNFLVNANVYFQLLRDKTKVDFSVVPGSSAYIRGNQLIVESDPYTGLSPSQSPPICSYDLFYDIIAPVKVIIKYNNIVIPFVIKLKVNNNIPFNGTDQEMELDNSDNPNPAIPETFQQCNYNQTILTLYGKKVQVLYNNKPVKDALVFVQGNPCSSKTNKEGIAYIMPNCIGCAIYAIKEGYISGIDYNDIRKSFILNLYKLMQLNIWTIYTPKWLIGNWSNETFTNLKFQGVEGNDFNNLDTKTIDLIKLNTTSKIPEQFKEIILPIRLNIRVNIVYNGNFSLNNISYMTNGAQLLANIPYQFYYSQEDKFIHKGQYVFSNSQTDYYYDDVTKQLVPCEVQAYEYKGKDFTLGKDLFLIRLSNNKVIEFPYYNGIFNVETQKTTLTKKYLVVCLPSDVSFKEVLEYSYDNNQKKWVKKADYSFSSLFRPLTN